MDRPRFQTGDTEADHARADDALIEMFKELIQYAPAGRATVIRVPPYTVLMPIRVSEQLVDHIVGRPTYCDRFEIQACGDGTYDLIVTQGQGDGALSELDWKPETGDA